MLRTKKNYREHVAFSFFNVLPIYYRSFFYAVIFSVDFHILSRADID